MAKNNIQNVDRIPGGFYIKARCIQQSDIATAPPHVREIWDWLIMNAAHKGSGKIKRGQLLTSYREILDGLCWYVGYRKCTYTKSQCETAMKTMTKHAMITTTKTTRGMIITVLNYDKFQNPKNYDNHTITSTKPKREPQWHDTIYKNEKNVIIPTSVGIGAKAPSRAKAKAKIKTKTKQPAPPTLEQVKEYFLANGYPEETAERFFHCYENGNPPWHDTKGNPVLAWKQKAHSVWFKKENKNNTREKSAWERLQDSQLNQARMLRAIREREQQHEQTTSDNCKRVCAIEHGPADPDS